MLTPLCFDIGRDEVCEGGAVCYNPVKAFQKLKVALGPRKSLHAVGLILCTPKYTP